MRTINTLLLLLITYLATAQTGEIAGIVLDEKKQPIISAIVIVYQGGIQKGGAYTGFDGDYQVKPLDPGLYTLVVTYNGYKKTTITDIMVGRLRVEQHINMQPLIDSLNKDIAKEITIKWKKPLLSKQPSQVINQEEIRDLVTPTPPDITALTPNVYLRRGISGPRRIGTIIEYIIPTTVTNKKGRPIRGAMVKLSTDTSKFHDTTQKDGHYTIPVGSAGEYTIIATRKGYTSQSRTITLSTTADTIHFTLRRKWWQSKK